MDDLSVLLALLNQHEVEYVVIGAHALAFHGHPRATKDIDVWVRRTTDNAQRLANALAEFGADIGTAGAMAFAFKERQMIRLGVPPHMVDILNFAGETDFESVWEGRVNGQLMGVRVNFVSRTALIEMKREAGRPQDLVDIQKLEAE